MESYIALISSQLFIKESERKASEDVAVLQDIKSACPYPLQDSLLPKIGTRKREERYKFLTDALCVQVIMTPQLLDSEALCDLVDVATDMRDENRGKFRVFVIVGIACEWRKRFPYLGPMVNGATFPMDGKQLYGRVDKEKQLQKFSRDMKSIVENL